MAEVHRKTAALRDDIRLSQNDVFGDQDFAGLPEEFEDTEAFGDNELTAEGELDDGFGTPEPDGIDASTDDGFESTAEGLPDPGNDDPGVNDFSIDDSVTGDPLSDDPSFDDTDVPAADNGVEELPPAPDTEGLTDEDVGPVRRPQMNGGEFGSTTDSVDNETGPADLSVFNGRNCPADLEVYEAAKTAFLNRPITAISLDITPEIEPNVSAEEMANRREERLRGAPEREWRNRKGEVVAKGYMRDFKNGRVHIESEDGETKEVDFYRLSSSDMCMVSAWWGIPTESQVEIGQYEVRNWTTQTFTWKASGLCHKPLYFEEVQLERYGHSAGPMKQTISSGVHFFGNLLFLPYKMGVHPPNECQYALGYYRPGDCAPWLLHAMPLSARGARWQTAAMLSGIWLVP